jgi:hypothetical protein
MAGTDCGVSPSLPPWKLYMLVKVAAPAHEEVSQTQSSERTNKEMESR